MNAQYDQNSIAVTSNYYDVIYALMNKLFYLFNKPHKPENYL